MMIVRRLHLAGVPDRKRKDQASFTEGSNEKGKGDDEPASWVALYRGFDPVEVRILADFLEREGIPVRLRQEAAGSAIPVNFGLLGEIEIMAPLPLAERAVSILDELNEAKISPDTAEAGDL